MNCVQRILVALTLIVMRRNTHFPFKDFGVERGRTSFAGPLLCMCSLIDPGIQVKYCLRRIGIAFVTVDRFRLSIQCGGCDRGGGVGDGLFCIGLEVNTVCLLTCRD